MRWELLKSVFVVVLLAAAFALGQVSTTAPAGNATELTSHDATPTFRSRVNEVMVRAVVRDGKGHAVGNLTRDDFQIFDKGAPQRITSFAVETPESLRARNAAPKPEGEAPDADAPQRFVAYLFDDIHIEQGDLSRVKAAAQRQLDALSPTDRAAIYTTSGQGMLDFTADRGQLRAAILALRPRPVARSNSIIQCPWMSYYMADLLANKNDPIALRASARQVMDCEHLDSSMMDSAQQMALAAAQMELANGNQETRLSIGVLNDVIRHLAAMPGQRSIVVVSPGFLTLADNHFDVTAAMDRALRAGIIISSVDARGLWSDPALDPTSHQADPQLQQYMRESAVAQADVLAEVADDTGGTYFHNNNDLDSGLRQAAAAPEFVYVMAFAPQNLKSDGKFHPLKLVVKSPEKLAVVARKGYFAPRKDADPSVAAKQEIADAIFSREEVQEIPVDVRTQYFMTAADAAKVAIIAHVDLKRVSFRKQDGRNLNTLTFACAVFDRNGKYVKGLEKDIEFHMHDKTLEDLSRTGIMVRSNFDLKAGGYMVRVVVRDSEGQMMSARNGAVDIP